MNLQKLFNYETFMKILRSASFFESFSPSDLKNLEKKYFHADEKSIKQAIIIIYRTEKVLQKAINQLKKHHDQQKDFQFLKNNFIETTGRDKTLAQIEKTISE